MKKIVAILLLALLTLALASCDAALSYLPGAAGSTTTEAVTTTAAPAPATPLTVVSCTEVSYVDGVHTYRITFSDGAVADFTVADGAAGLPGANGTNGQPGANGAPGTNGTSPTVVSCEAVGTVGDETTYRITFSDGATAEFTVKNGADGAPGANGQPGTPGVSPTVVSCEPIGTVGNETTYRITFSDGATADFTVKNGADGAPGANGQPGTPGVSPTVVSCEAVGTVDNVTTWRLTFSDGSTADFSVTNGSSPDGVDWEELMARLEAMNDLLTVESPDMSVGNSTVSNPSNTVAGTYKAPTNVYIIGRGFPLSKKVMFGDADTVHAVRLNGFRVFHSDGTLVTSGEVTIGIEIRRFTASKLPSDTRPVGDGGLSYVTTVTLDGVYDYIDLDLTIPRSDFDSFGDDEFFYMSITTLGDPDLGLAASHNPTFHYATASTAEYRVDKGDGTFGAYFYFGYSGNSQSGIYSNSYSVTGSDVFFCTAMKRTVIDLSGLAGSGNGNNNNGGNENVQTPAQTHDNILQLPEQYDLVVGDNFELFYSGITLCINSDVFDYKLTFADGKSRGHNYARKYVWEPTASDVGVHYLTIDVRDNYGTIVDSGTVKLNVVNKPVSPEDELVFLFIGASNSKDGIWQHEVIRRLTGTDTTVIEKYGNGTIKGTVTGPMGDGLTNIKTIGTLSTTFGDSEIFYEGYGGWSFTSYSTANMKDYFVYIDGDFASLTLSQHSFYQDGNGQTWKLEHIDTANNRLKLIAVTGIGGAPATSCQGLNCYTDPTTGKVVIPATGSLTLLSGGENDAKTITYTATAKAEGNPFWNAAAGKNDFLAYAAKHGVDHIDEVVINLGWNSTNGSAAQLVLEAKVLIDSILEAFPDCHINLVGLPIGSRDGFGENYGVAWDFYEKTKLIFEFQDAFIALTHEDGYAGSVSFISVAGQFDAENGYLTTTRPINNRVPTTETVQNNGVHPNTTGHYQQADAVYRHIVTRLQGNN